MPQIAKSRFGILAVALIALVGVVMVLRSDREGRRLDRPQPASSPTEIAEGPGALALPVADEVEVQRAQVDAPGEAGADAARAAHP